MGSRGSRRFLTDVAIAGAWAAALSGIPSTLHAWWTGGDLLEATRAAGAMLVSSRSSDARLIAAALVVHVTVTIFWATLLTWLLPRRHVVVWAVLASAAIAVLDLLVIARLFFPEVYALPFWPQFADHLAWGALLGGALAWRARQRQLTAPKRSLPRSV